MEYNTSVDFTCLAFKNFLNFDEQEIRAKFNLKNDASFLKPELQQAVWNFCVAKKLDPLTENVTDLIDLSLFNSDVFHTGYPHLVLNKKQAFLLSTRLLENYHGVISLNLLLSGRKLPASPYLTTDFNKFNFSCFLAIFTAFGLHLKTNKKILMHYIKELKIIYLEESEDYFLQLDNVHANQFLNLILQLPRCGKENFEEPDYDKVLPIFKNSVTTIKQYSIVGKLLGITKGALNYPEQKTYSKYVLERFVNIFNITQEQLQNNDFIVTLTEELKAFAQSTPEDHTVINPTLSVPTEEIHVVLKFLYELILKFIGNEFFERNKIISNNLLRTIKNKSQPLNYFYKILVLLGLTNNNLLINLLFKVQNGSNVREEDINRIADVTEEHLTTPSKDPLITLSLLNIEKQEKEPFYKKLDINTYGESNANTFLVNYLNQKSAQVFGPKIPDNVCVVHQLLNSNGEFKDNTVIALALGQVYDLQAEINDDLFLEISNKDIYCYLESTKGDLEFKLLRINNNQIIFYDNVSNFNTELYQQNITTFKKLYSKLILIYNVDYI